MMKKPCLSFFVCLCVVVPSSMSHAEPKTLFNGQDLKGWTTYVAEDEIAPQEAWSVVDGVIRASGKGKGYLLTDRAYADYVLRLEWRWPEGDSEGRANSGVMVHIVGPDQLWPKSFEAQLKSGSAGDFASFEDARSDDEIVSRNPRGVSTGRLPRQGPSPEKPAGEWNHYEITALGDELILKINGQEVNRMRGVKPSAGHIGLQSEGYPIEFRSVTLETLPPAKDLHAPMPQ